MTQAERNDVLIAILNDYVRKIRHNQLHAQNFEMRRDAVPMEGQPGSWAMFKPGKDHFISFVLTDEPDHTPAKMEAK